MSDTVSEVLKIFNKNWNKQVILYGPPGTSKTYSATIIAAAMLVGASSKDDIPERIIEALFNINNNTNRLTEEEKNYLARIKTLTNEVKIDTIRNNLFYFSSLYLKCCNNYKLVQFHPSYSYEDFVRGIKVKPMESEVIEIVGPNGEKYTIPKRKSGSGVTYEVEPKIIENFCKQEGTKVLVIDEINRAPLASVLGELIYGLEYRGEKISTPYEIKEKVIDAAGKDIEKIVDLIIPEDLYIIGTMNTADRSIGTMDYAVRRRFAFVPVLSDPEKINGSWIDSEAADKAVKLYNKINSLFEEKYLEDKELDPNDIKIGHTYFLGKKGKDKSDGEEYLKYRFNYQIRPIYMEYVKDGLINSKGKEEFEKINIESLL